MKDDELQTIELTVQGIALDGGAMSLENTDLDTLQRLIKQLKDIIGSDCKVPVKLETGSIRTICLLAPFLAVGLLADIDHYRQGNHAAIADKTRLKALVAMDKDAQKMGREYTITANGKEYLRIDQNHHKAATRSRLLDMETELEGIVVDAGGQGKPNIHMETRRGKCTISATREQLSKIEGNILYKQIRLAVACKYDLTANTTRDYVLKDIVELSDAIEEEAVNAVIAHGTEVWKDVEDPYKWLAEMRGEEL